MAPILPNGSISLRISPPPHRGLRSRTSFQIHPSINHPRLNRQAAFPMYTNNKNGSIHSSPEKDLPCIAPINPRHRSDAAPSFRPAFQVDDPPFQFQAQTCALSQWPMRSFLRTDWSELTCRSERFTCVLNRGLREFRRVSAVGGRGVLQDISSGCRTRCWALTWRCRGAGA